MPDSKEILSRIQSHYAEGEGASKEITEWGLTVYRKPLTIQQKEELLKMSKGSNAELLSWAIVRLALDESGEKIFAMGDRKVFLDGADGDVVAELGNWLLLPSGEMPLAEEPDPKN